MDLESRRYRISKGMRENLSFGISLFGRTLKNADGSTLNQFVTYGFIMAATNSGNSMPRAMTHTIYRSFLFFFFYPL